MAFLFTRLRDRDPHAGDEPRSELSKDPIEPDIGVNGWTLLWALIGVVLFLYHWGGVLVFVSRIALNGTPYAFVEAGSRAPRPLGEDDIVFIRRGEPSLAPGQILWVADQRRPRLARLLVAGPDSIRVARLANADRLMTEGVRASAVQVTDQQIVIGVGGSAALDTLGEIVPRHWIRGRAVQVVLPPHRMRALP